ncbi:MAG TPA: nuclear transport factor 2 family protein [Streptomyces sp.]|uniref:nuclear transport factor 2 family protein n=1 Tax=Streptomyces sp. TaxID=1931 RepID=UPI002C334A83|nr:nuclear transport factor 2 family protein [Streptomyces sp.]HWU06033.1 nuclear transport factor 2 family protein [Streptomyces sp.]
MTAQLLVPPFAEESAAAKVRRAEDAWNTRDPEKVAPARTQDSRRRNRAERVTGRKEIIRFLTRKWARELDHRPARELWVHEGNRIAVRFAYEWHDDGGRWYRSLGNENREFDSRGLMRVRHASIDDVPTEEAGRRFRRPLGPRPDNHPGLIGTGF